jgi:thiamine biosynthesis protein ThiS
MGGGMKIKLNNIELALSEAMSLSSLLNKYGYESDNFAVAVNGAFVPKAAHSLRQIEEADVIMIIKPMQGG